MKAFKWVAAAALVLLACAAVFAWAWAGTDETAKYRGNVSEVRSNILGGESQHFEVMVYTGKRESPYKLDGVANPLKDYFLVMAFPKVELEYGDTVTATVRIGEKKYTKTLAQHPYNGSYAADFADSVVSGENVIVNVTAREFDEDVPVLSLLTEGMMDSDAAFKKGIELLKSSIDSTEENGKFLCEIHVKLIKDTRNEETKLYWHVYIWDQNGEEYAVMLEADAALAEQEQ